MARTAGQKSHLDTGDLIEYSVSAQIRTGGAEMWLKMGASTTVRESESATKAMQRLTTWVEDQLAEKISELT